jgi:hypothetical protein
MCYENLDRLVEEFERREIIDFLSAHGPHGYVATAYTRDTEQLRRHMHTQLRSMLESSTVEEREEAFDRRVNERINQNTSAREQMRRLYREGVWEGSEEERRAIATASRQAVDELFVGGPSQDVVDRVMRTAEQAAAQRSSEETLAELVPVVEQALEEDERRRADRARVRQGIILKLTCEAQAWLIADGRTNTATEVVRRYLGMNEEEWGPYSSDINIRHEEDIHDNLVIRVRYTGPLQFTALSTIAEGQPYPVDIITLNRIQELMEEENNGCIDRNPRAD